MRITTLLEDSCSEASYLKGYSPATLKRYRTNVRLFAGRTGVQDIELITKDMVRSFFVEGRTRYHWASATFITYHKSLKVFLRWCAKVRRGTRREPRSTIWRSPSSKRSCRRVSPNRTPSAFSRSSTT